MEKANSVDNTTSEDTAYLQLEANEQMRTMTKQDVERNLSEHYYLEYQY